MNSLLRWSNHESPQHVVTNLFVTFRIHTFEEKNEFVTTWAEPILSAPSANSGGSNNPRLIIICLLTSLRSSADRMLLLILFFGGLPLTVWRVFDPAISSSFPQSFGSSS